MNTYPKKNGFSPWGEIQTVTGIAPGIYSVTTASHGGLWVSDERMAMMPDALKCNVYGEGQWFEEDCEWALVVLAFPTEFTNDKWLIAAQTIGSYIGGGVYQRAAQWLAQKEPHLWERRSGQNAVVICL